MSDEELCEYCGKAYSPQGISMHEQHCDENPANQDDDSDEGDDAADPSGVGVLADSSEVGEAVLERCDGTCQFCEDVEVETLHKLNPDDGRTTANLVGLCRSCEDELEGLHPLTKRSKVYHE